MSTTGRHGRHRRDLAVTRYVAALDAGDADAVARVLAEAEGDPELDRILATVDAAMHQECGLLSFEESAQAVRRLLLRHLPGALTQSTEFEPVTVRDVAARIQNDAALWQLSASDRLLNQRLLRDTRTLPQPVTAVNVAGLAAALGHEGSPRYWELFRRTGVILAVARQHDRVELAAARRRADQQRARPRSTPEAR